MAVEEKKSAYKKWYKSRTVDDLKKYKEAKRNAKKAVVEAKGVKQKELMQELSENAKSTQVFRIAKQIARERVDIVGASRCLKDGAGNFSCG